MRQLVTRTSRATLRDLPLRTHAAAALLLALLVIALRLPGIAAPLGIDEGGMTLIGSDWLRTLASGAHGDSLYGNLWIDRPPLILALYGFADIAGGAIGVRVLGIAAALVTAVLAGSIAERLGGRRAWLPAALITGVLLSTPSVDGDRTAGELLAAVPSAMAVALLAGVALSDHRRRRGASAAPERGIGSRSIGPSQRLLLIGGAGVAAACAPLIKQSALDGCFVALSWFVWRAVRDRASGGGWRGLGRDLAVFTGGAVATTSIIVGLALRAGASVSDLTYALIGFRVDVLIALGQQSASPAERVTRLIAPAAASGILLVALLVPFAIWIAARRGPLHGAGAALLIGWLFAAVIGVAGGGYYWAHYLLQLVPPIGAAAGIVLARRHTLVSASVITVLVLVASVGQLVRAQDVTPDRIARAGYHVQDQKPAVALGEFVRRNSRTDDRVAVLYARANIAYYAQRQPATSFLWSSMYRALPAARADLLRSLSGPDRTAWVVMWQPTTSYGLDHDHKVRDALKSGYSPVIDMCGKPILLRNDRSLASVIMPVHHCPAPGPQRVYLDVPVSTGFTRG